MQTKLAVMGEEGQEEVSDSMAFKFSATTIMPAKLDLTVDRGEAFTLWQYRWEDFVHLSSLEKKDPPTQMAVLRTCLSDETLKVVMNLPDVDKNDCRSVIKALRSHAQGQLNVVMERRNFNLRQQHDGESFDDFLTDIKELAKTCQFCDQCQPSLIRDRIVVGIRDSETIEHLLVEKNVPLDKAVEICRAEEAAKRHCGEIKGDDACASANAISRYKSQGK